MKRGARVAAALCLAAQACAAAALTPAEVYALVAPSVWRVVTYDGDGLPLSQGSAVVVGPEALATNCHVLAKARRVVVRHEQTTFDAKLELWDTPRGLELTMSAGIVSSLRKNNAGQVVLVQTSASISGGSSGGGLFDDSGALVGLTTIGSVTGDAQNLNFAIPADWIVELPDRHARLSRNPAGAGASAAAAGASR